MSEINDIINYVRETPTNTNPAVLRSMLTTLAEGGGSGLPEVSESDNGDVLTVVEGVWAKAAPSGGGFQLFEDTEVTTMARSGKFTTSQGTEFTIPAWMGEDEIMGLILNEGLQGYEIVIPSFTLTIDGVEHTFEHAYFSDAITEPVYEIEGNTRYFLDYYHPEGDQPYVDMQVSGSMGSFGEQVTISLPAMTIQKVNGDIVKIVNNILSANA